MSQCLNLNCLYQNPISNKFCCKCGFKLLLKDRYRPIQLIGQGGFGRTFLARDEDKPSKPYCVIKQFFPSVQETDTVQKASELFEQEAIRLEHLEHSQIPKLYAYFISEDNRQYLIQEYIEGINLEQELNEQGIFDEVKIRSLLEDILPILEFIHINKVIHRDIKPDNIIRRKNDGKLVLVDFGAAKLINPSNVSVTGTIIGSMKYIAPEQARGKVRNNSDLYSLGVTCIYLLTGASLDDLFDDEENQWVWRNCLNNNPVSDELGLILDKLIEIGTKNRYQSATEVLQQMKSKSKSKTTSTKVEKEGSDPDNRETQININFEQTKSDVETLVKNFEKSLKNLSKGFGK